MPRSALALFGFACVACTNDFDGLELGAAGTSESATAAAGGGAGSSGLTTGAGGGGAMGGREGDGGVGGSETACGPGTVSAIVDDFDDGIIGGPWSASSDPSVEESRGLLQLTPGPEVEDVHGVQTEVGYSLLGCSIHAELVGPPGDGDAVIALFQLRNGNDAFVRWAMNETTILARIADGATDLQSRKVPLDPDAHRWLRIREGGGTVFFETSSDGQAWATFLGAPTPSFAGFARVSVRTHTVSSVSSPSVVQFD